MTEERNTEQELNSQTDEETVEEVFAENEASEKTEEMPSQEEEQDPMEKKVAELQGKLDEADNRYLRLQADFDNFRRRSRIELEASAKYRAQSIITDLLPAIDNFERALKMEVDNEQSKSLKQGVEMVYRSLLDALKNEGVEVIEAVGKEFDPHLHQAVMQAEDENFGPNIVVEEFQKGYMLKDRIIRPAMVKVNQ
ncbi:MULTISPECIES: nucleotide exchange factor GrpE [unclassified Bacillus (in: firmicutes)]|uniref:nucleotide exchange factor GrpE n=1 Tax=unclassified Bacillus (in: firmicutes) TaxID=185979 RepID=UPI001BEA6128|nr:nucleotide exchange factor GrpE [Bacillus sp. ISL-39]MBT2660749.1 nucleotide exchange factor GrpE [Bacillus sp. ISL-45]